METLHTVLLVLQVLVAISLIGMILIQHGKGADAGAAFGSGASHTVFGAQGSGNFLSRTTAILAFIFLTNSLGLAYIASQRSQASRSLMDQPVTEVQLNPGQTSDVINEIPADPVNQTVIDIPADPAATISEIPVEPDSTSSQIPVEPVIDVPLIPEIEPEAIQIVPADPAVETAE